MKTPSDLFSPNGKVAVVLLTSDAGAFITGSEHPVEGGYNAMSI